MKCLSSAGRSSLRASQLLQRQPSSASPSFRSSSARPTSSWSKQAERKVIFSGIQPTGVPHLGNYLGALKQWRKLQDDALDTRDKLLFSIVDLHAITVPRERGLLTRWKREMMAALLAIGLDPNRSVIFHQSAVPAHSELQWILCCSASTGYLSRMTQWKSKMALPDNADISGSTKNVVKHGLFSYPVLQAADILVHRATHVPVGEDQKQHLEFARECVTNFNHTYNTACLVTPETILCMFCFPLNCYPFPSIATLVTIYPRKENAP